MAKKKDSSIVRTAVPSDATYIDNRLVIIKGEINKLEGYIQEQQNISSVGLSPKDIEDNIKLMDAIMSSYLKSTEKYMELCGLMNIIKEHFEKNYSNLRKGSEDNIFMNSLQDKQSLKNGNKE